MKRSHKIIARALLAGFIILILGLAISWLWINHYLQSENFRRMLSAKASSAIKADGEFLPLHWTGSSVYSDSFQANRKTGGPFELRANQIRADLNLRALFYQTWQIDELNIQSLQVALMPSSETDKPDFPHQSAVNETQSSSSWLPNKTELKQIVIQDALLKWEPTQSSWGKLEGMRLLITPAAEIWNISATGGRLHQSGFPTLEVDQFKLKCSKERLFVTEANLKCPESGLISVNGEVDFTKSDLDLHVKFDGPSVTPFIPENWRAKLKGNLVGTSQVKGSYRDPKSLQVTGSAHLTSAQLEALPILDQIALFTQTQRFRHLILQKASADFVYTPEKLIVTQLIMESDDLLRIEGNFTLVGDAIDGQFQVGIASSSLRWLPGAQSKVFTVTKDGYQWAPMRLTGTLQNPQEDLTPRLIAAAQSQIIDTLGNTAKDALELLKPFIQ
jgi:hypothetical protein